MINNINQTVGKKLLIIVGNYLHFNPSLISAEKDSLSLGINSLN